MWTPRTSEDGGGKYGGEGGGGAVLPGPDPDLVETLAVPVIAEGVSGAAAGNSQGTSSGVPISALPRRVAASSRTTPASGRGRTTGEVPNVIATVSLWTNSSSATRSVVGRVSSWRSHRASDQRFSLPMVLRGPVQRMVP